MGLTSDWMGKAHFGESHGNYKNCFYESIYKSEVYCRHYDYKKQSICYIIIIYNTIKNTKWLNFYHPYPKIYNSWYLLNLLNTSNSLFPLSKKKTKSFWRPTKQIFKNRVCSKFAKIQIYKLIGCVYGTNAKKKKMNQRSLLSMMNSRKK